MSDNIYDTINVRFALREQSGMTDEKFEEFLPEFCEKLVDYTFDRFLKDYIDNLDPKKNDWDNLVKTKADKDWINSTSVVGMKIIKKHMPHIYEVSNFKGLNIRDLWNAEHIEKALRVNRKSHSTPYTTEIIRQLGFIAGTSKVTIYRPLLTKRIIQEFNGKNVLDVCVGWGGRMLGSTCIDGVKYTGIEPNSKTFKGLEDMVSELGLGERVTLYKDCAENKLSELNREYDVALTSPPYYNLEVYSDESTQSHQYGSYDDWKEYFLKPIVHGVLEKLVDGGKSCWSVKNFKTDKQYNLYDDVKSLHEEKGWKKIEREFYVGNCLRPGANKQGKEITYVFMKE